MLISTFLSSQQHKAVRLLQELWNNRSSRWMRKDLGYQKALLDALVGAKHYQFAEFFLLEKLKEELSLSLLAYADQIPISNRQKLVLLLEKKLKKDPENAAIHHALAKLKLDDDKDQDVIDHLKKSIELDPSVDSFALLGKVLEKMDNLDEANNYYRQGMLLLMSSK